MLGFCDIHNKTENVNVSSTLKKILKKGCSLKEEKLVKVFIIKMEGGVETRKYTYFISGCEADKLKINNGSGVIKLFDRDRKKKEMNDRILAVEIKRNTTPICDDCFEKLSSIMNFNVDSLI